jgi:SAM-dependent methyltransferase
MMMNFHQHLDLLFRWERGLSLRKAIFASVKSNSCVLDAGCGSGLLSFWAAQAGAKCVVGVDTCDLSLAKTLAEENNFEKKVTFIQSDLLSDELVKAIGKYDVILGMLYYNDPRRDEAQSQLTYEIHKRFLSDYGVRIPDRVEYGQNIQSFHQDLQKNIKVLEQRYGLKFDALCKEAIGQIHPNWFPQRLPSGKLNREGAGVLSEETFFATIDYSENFNNGYPKNITFKISSPGIFTAVVWRQKLYYKDSLIFYNESVSWVGNPIRVEEKDQIKLLIDDRWRKSNILTVE